jgi:hypothetical protein
MCVRVCNGQWQAEHLAKLDHSFNNCNDNVLKAMQEAAAIEAAAISANDRKKHRLAYLSDWREYCSTVLV